MKLVMKAASSEPLELMEHLALVTARQQRDPYLQQLGSPRQWILYVYGELTRLGF
jgi:hypothetical protein